MGFSRQEYWSGLPFPSPGDLPDPGMEPGSPTWKADPLPSEPPGKPSKSSLVGGIETGPAGCVPRPALPRWAFGHIWGRFGLSQLGAGYAPGLWWVEAGGAAPQRAAPTRPLMSAVLRRRSPAPAPPMPGLCRCEGVGGGPWFPEVHTPNLAP